MGEREVFGMVWPVWQREQLHRALIQQIITLACITTLAGGDHVGPVVLAATRSSQHMITTQVTFLEYLAAV